MLVVSFVALGALWKRPLLARHADGRAATGAVSRRSCSARCASSCRRSPSALFALVWAAALVGDTDPLDEPRADVDLRGRSGSGCRCSRCFSATCGARSARGARSPTRTSGCESSAAEKRGRSTSYPERPAASRRRSPCWPSPSLELTYSDPSSPRALAFAIALYTYWALFGMASFGREKWCERGEGFAVLFGLLRPHRPAARDRGTDSAALAVHRARGRRSRAGHGGVLRGDARIGPLRRLQPHDDVARPDRAGSRPRTCSTGPGSASCSSRE